jgi:hypothetical protein
MTKEEAKEVLTKKFHITEMTKFHSYEYLYKVMIKLMESL